MSHVDVGRLAVAGVATASAKAITRTLTSLDAVDAMAESWQALERRTQGPHLFQRHAWCRQIVESVADRRGAPRARVIVVERDGVVEAIQPISVIRRGPLRIARHLGEPLAQYCDALGSPRIDVEPILREMERWGDVDAFVIRRVREDARILPGLRAAGALTLASDLAVSAHLTDWPDAEAYGRAINAGAARDRRRLRRRAEETGRVGFRMIRAGSEARRHAEVAIEWKRTWLGARGLGSQAFDDPLWTTCLATIVEQPQSGAAVGVLSIDDEPAAIEVGFVDDGHLYAYIGAFAPQHEKAGVGRVVMDEVVRWCFANGVQDYDLLSPAAPYKSQWTDRATPVHDLAVPLSALGWLYLHGYQRHGRALLRRAWLALPATLRSRIKRS